MVEHVAVLNFTRMGDIVQSSPLLYAIKEQHPQAKLTLIVLNAFRGVGERLPMVDCVCGFDIDEVVRRLDHEGDLPSVFRQLSAFTEQQELRKIDLLFNLSHTPLSATLSRLLSPQDMVGYYRRQNGHQTVANDWINYLFSVMHERRLNPFNLVEIYLRLAPVPLSTPRLRFNPTETDRRNARGILSDVGVNPNTPYIVLQPGASSFQRQWPAANFAEIARQLETRGIQCVVVGSKSEGSLAMQVEESSGGAAKSIVGRTDIGTLTAVLEAASKLVSNDTGTIHLAAAVETPIIGVFVGPASAKDTAPYGSGHIILEPDLADSPCKYNCGCANPVCHASLGVHHVLDLVLASPDDAIESAKALRGVRAYMTEVTRSGEFVLHKLNETRTATVTDLHQSYRSFWDRFLGYASPSVDSVLQFGGDECETGVKRLKAIRRDSILKLETLVRACSQGRIAASQLNDLLRDQVSWQSELHSFVQEFPDLSAFPLFLLTKAVSVRSSSIEEYISDTSEILSLFGKGIGFLTPSAESVQAPPECKVA